MVQALFMGALVFLGMSVGCALVALFQLATRRSVQDKRVITTTYVLLMVSALMFAAALLLSRGAR